MGFSCKLCGMAQKRLDIYLNQYSPDKYLSNFLSISLMLLFINIKKWKQWCDEADLSCGDFTAAHFPSLWSCWVHWPVKVTQMLVKRHRLVVVILPFPPYFMSLNNDSLITSLGFLQICFEFELNLLSHLQILMCSCWWC